MPRVCRGTRTPLDGTTSGLSAPVAGPAAIRREFAQRLVGDLKEQYPDSTHVIEDLGQSASDDAIWEFARAEGFTKQTVVEYFLEQEDATFLGLG